MRWFGHLNISFKLGIAFALMAVLLVFTGTTGLSQLGKMNDALGNLYDNNLVPIANLSGAQAKYELIAVNIRDYRTFGDNAQKKKQYENNITDAEAEVIRQVDVYRGTKITPPEVELLAQFDSVWQAYQNKLQEALQLASSEQSEAFETLLQGDLKNQGDAVSQKLKDLVALNTKIANDTSDSGDRMYASSRRATLAVIAAALLLSVALGFYISRHISRPLRRTVELVGRVAQGDLRETSDIDTRDEVGRLAASVNRMIEDLRGTVGRIQYSAENVSSATQQISASTEEIAGGSSSQANSAQTMTELFKELSEAIGSVARSAEHASDLSNAAMAIAQDGSRVVEASIQGMNEVNEQMARLAQDSEQVGEIVSVIDDIAEQTNLLALNAAIEAARAGDQGRGFAVVADEVRKLAERSGEATKQIAQIVKGMQANTRRSEEAVANGLAGSRRSGEAFGDILAKVSESAGRVAEIAAASEQQAAQSSDMMASIESISAAAEEAAASSQETAATAQTLAGLAEELNASVAMFRTDKV
ncbi:methyl-accepting chemotaxis protein [Cohnella rhizosphaerae]|uniref:Methyl-accepting chemotaxis protein n=1 Tax=Cohnella rhizosphaerae TaxID=1457232 RepID=A0A9X4KRI2_9BACL|nr:methyl-accepting chemotaxis protein [Cohnella rhizosphaerae]MDG0809510.1 methyl-accepting chemotaxis protein [Cohnella rhizosphaerae]